MDKDVKLLRDLAHRCNISVKQGTICHLSKDLNRIAERLEKMTEQLHKEKNGETCTTVPN